MIDLGLDGVPCIVTGGTRGIGRAITELFLDQGALVVATGLHAATGSRLRSDLAAHGDALQVVVQDLRDSNAGTQLVDVCEAQFGGVQVLVNNASSFDPPPSHGPGPRDWLALFEVKALGYLRLVRAVTAAMTSGGAVTNIAGTAGVHASPGVPHIGAVNAALVSATESWAAELAGAGIRVNVVSPGLTATDRLRDPSAAAGVPVGHAVDPAEIARMVALLSSPLSSSTTGAHVVVDGGSTLGARRRT